MVHGEPRLECNWDLPFHLRSYCCLWGSNIFNDRIINRGLIEAILAFGRSWGTMAVVCIILGSEEIDFPQRSLPYTFFRFKRAKTCEIDDHFFTHWGYGVDMELPHAYHRMVCVVCVKVSFPLGSVACWEGRRMCLPAPVSR